jgi:hypothetical protein
MIKCASSSHIQHPQNTGAFAEQPFSIELTSRLQLMSEDMSRNGSTA